ncbi:histamine H2 receptor-like [Exaiptasia diaphana]|uniref:G-protein coupled receptors family 1 profile domain-containing protein n=1 Tax=Exaiptasia diaphana TaxID=2652724 RepID=A0A913XLZ9_EXADI|nr:histamine H2 receptor-like [Exaiptasia diaphana]XP_020906454.1 histamine H2 receptor-like [Exaiptasia diaphana]XP_020906455.1 histamine H2 receptor-like [Exaiptasia diaphana]XP_028516500.1 histamine H2 receptor-like [Exaiptasia diaphana]
MWSTSWLFVIEAIAIVTGNAISIVIFTSTRRLRNRKFMTIVNLAVADLLSGLVCLPLVVYYFEGAQRHTQTFLTIYNLADSFFGAASIFSLAALAIERLHATYFPFKHEGLSKRAYVIGIAVVWMSALLHALAAQFLSYFAHILKIVVVIGLALAVVSISYLLIWIKVTRMSGLPVQAIQEENKKLTITLLIVTTVSYITMLPLMITMVYTYACGSWCLDSHYSLLVALAFLHYMNSLVNFIIYALRMQEFRGALLRRLGCSRQYGAARTIDKTNETIM